MNFTTNTKNSYSNYKQINYWWYIHISKKELVYKYREKRGKKTYNYIHCKNELVILTLIWLLEFQCCIDNKYYACEV